ncbi:MAG: 16S rRNA (guanine(966)-N(2))-methyltransferase RsmD [Candidatus Lokiarchaeota archaeon]|nr:16S rRNA (guanine(966)-N(2))-methyltransferase RsmD [Candidatus Lokiarchaeota archaeon]
MKKRTTPRIIAGKMKGKRLKSLPGNQTRPITDRVKENLFNIIGSDIYDSKFLDAFAGTGSVGIEAYSRGAQFVQFVEKYQKPYLILKENLADISNSIAVSLIQTDAFKFLNSSIEQIFDYIYIAPPQYKQMWELAISNVDKTPKLLNSGGWMIVQIDPIEYKTIQLDNFIEFDTRKYGSTLLVFFTHKN